MKHILIDGDILTYRIGFSVESSVYVVNNTIYKRKGFAERHVKEHGGEIFKRKNIGSMKDLVRNLQITMKTMFDDIGSNQYTMFLTDSSRQENFRSSIATVEVYKGNRSVIAKPFFYKKIRELLIKDYKAVLVSGQEADDAIGIAQYKASRNAPDGSRIFGGTIIASIDKDLQVLEGEHYHMVNRTITTVTYEDALKNFCKQLLTGDRTDCVPGLPGILKHLDRREEANKLIYNHYIQNYVDYSVDHTPKECYDYVVSLYDAHGIDPKLREEISNLVWIRRNENENFSDWIETNDF